MFKAELPALVKTNLDETNFLGIAPEALPTTHETIFPDNSMRISTDPAATHQKMYMR